MFKSEAEIQKSRTRTGFFIFIFSFAIFFLIISQCKRQEFNEHTSTFNDNSGKTYPCGNMNISTRETILGEQVYKQYCAACHFKNKNMTGPALEESYFIYGPELLQEFIKNEDSLISTESFGEYKDRNQSYHPYSHKFQLNEEEMKNLLEYLKY